MPRPTRDRDAERARIRAAADRLLAGTPLRDASGRLTATALIAESGLRRDVVYEHPDLVEDYQARVKAQGSTPAAVQDLADRNAALTAELAAVKQALAEERATARALRKAAAELSLELHLARQELAGHGNVTRLPPAAPR